MLSDEIGVSFNNVKLDLSEITDHDSDYIMGYGLFCDVRNYKLWDEYGIEQIYAKLIKQAKVVSQVKLF